MLLVYTFVLLNKYTLTSRFHKHFVRSYLFIKFIERLEGSHKLQTNKI